MNYGREFIKIYNKNLSNFKKEIIKRIEKDYGSPNLDEDLRKEYLSEIQGKSNKIRKKDNKGEYNSGLTGLSLGFMSKAYKFNRVENIINEDIYNLFIEKEKYSSYQDFNQFLTVFSMFLVYNEYREFITSNQKVFNKHLNKEKIKSFFIIKNIKDDLNKLDLNFGNKNKNTNEESTNLISNQIELEDIEKSILLNILFFHLNDKVFNSIPNTEKYRLLLLCSSVLKEEDYYKVKTGYKAFDYFKLGVNKSQKFRGDKRKMIEDLIIKLEKLTYLKEVVISIKKLKLKDNFYC